VTHFATAAMNDYIYHNFYCSFLWDAVPNPARGIYQASSIQEDGCAAALFLAVLIPLDSPSQHHVYGVAVSGSKGMIPLVGV